MASSEKVNSRTMNLCTAVSHGPPMPNEICVLVVSTLLHKVIVYAFEDNGSE